MRAQGTRKLPSIRLKNTRRETAVSQAARDFIAQRWAMNQDQARVCAHEAEAVAGRGAKS